MSFWSNLSDWWGRVNYGPMNESAKQNGLGHYAWTDDRYDGKPLDRFLAATDNPLAYSVREKLGLTSSDGNDTQQLLDQVASLQRAEIEQQTQHDKDMFWLGQYSADQAMQFEKEMTDLNWQRQMDASNSAWQRQVEDMKKAGINPIAYFANNSGSGASSPSASAASGKQASSQASKLPTGQVADLLKQQITNSAMMANQGLSSIASLAGVLLGLKSKEAEKLASAFSGKMASQTTTRSKRGSTTTYTYYS